LRVATAMGTVLVILVASGCNRTKSPTSTESERAGASASPSAAAGGSGTAGCGITIEEVKSELPSGTPVDQNRTPDPRRCNFTWAQNGNWGIDVVYKPGGRAELEASDSAPGAGGKLKNGKPYESVAGLGDKAWANGDARQVGVAAIKGDDVAVVGITYDGPPQGATTKTGMNAEYLRICTELAKKVLA
jgi:hypothetical protein